MHANRCHRFASKSAHAPQRKVGLVSVQHKHTVSFAKCRFAQSQRGPTPLHVTSQPAGIITEQDLKLLDDAAKLADSSAGLTQPHPNAACILVDPQGRSIGQAFQRAQGTTPAEVVAARQAGEAARGATAYLNLETGDCHGDDSAVAALIQSGVERVVVGLRHPLSHLRGKGIAALAQHGVAVSILGESDTHDGVLTEDIEATLTNCLHANEALLHRATLRRPLSILKYAMTLDGKIATAMGHSAWVSSSASRALVFEQRARSDAVIVGGNTVRRDNPRLTTRQEGGHSPVRVLMSRTLDLPEHANLWDVAIAPTIVMTQRGARQRFQQHLRSRGVEVVEFDFLTPEGVVDYCYERGFLQVFWECGGTLAAPAIASGVIHKLMAFVAPKIIGGTRAPTPVGELGFVEMTQAVNLVDTVWKPVGPDLMITGYLPSSGGLLSLERVLSYPGRRPGAMPGNNRSSSSSSRCSSLPGAVLPASSSSASASSSSSSSITNTLATAVLRNRCQVPPVISFYKAWDEWGALANFSPHPIVLPAQHVRGCSSGSHQSNASQQQPATTSSQNSAFCEWPTVEHYYQSSKFGGVDHPDAVQLCELIPSAPSPEEAARLGRRAERERPELIRPDWSDVKGCVMLEALRAKFRAHEGPRKMLLSTAGGKWGEFGAELVENSPHDMFWGQGYDGSGQNQLGKLLMQVRNELVAEFGAAELSANGLVATPNADENESQHRELANAGRSS